MIITVQDKQLDLGYENRTDLLKISSCRTLDTLTVRSWHKDPKSRSVSRIDSSYALMILSRGGNTSDEVKITSTVNKPTPNPYGYLWTS